MCSAAQVYYPVSHIAGCQQESRNRPNKHGRSVDEGICSLYLVMMVIL